MIIAPNDDAGKQLADISIRMLALRDEVLEHWIARVRAEVRGARHISTPVIANTLPAFFENVALSLSPAFPRNDATDNNNAAAQHGSERARMTPYGPEQVIHEYQLFRAAIYAVAADHGLLFDTAQRGIVDAGIDNAQREAIAEFSAIHEVLRRKLAATLSHDMLSPLAAVVSGAELITLAQDLPGAKKTARRIIDNGQRLGRMIAQLLEALTISAADELPIDPAAFDIRLLARTVCEEFSAQHVPISLEGGSVIGYWDFGQLQRALENLVRNAVKYGDGQTVTIRTSETQGRLMISVHNTGNPIGADRFEHIFAYLHRENVVPAEGYGIGLPFVKAVAQSHGGSVVVDSGRETGTTFVIDIPVDCRPFVDASITANSAPASN